MVVDMSLVEHVIPFTIEQSVERLCQVVILVESVQGDL